MKFTIFTLLFFTFGFVAATPVEILDCGKGKLRDVNEAYFNCGWRIVGDRDYNNNREIARVRFTTTYQQFESVTETVEFPFQSSSFKSVPEIRGQRTLITRKFGVGVNELLGAPAVLQLKAVQEESSPLTSLNFPLGIGTGQTKRNHNLSLNLTADEVGRAWISNSSLSIVVRNIGVAATSPNAVARNSRVEKVNFILSEVSDSSWTVTRYKTVSEIYHLSFI
ncbi:hypothetical protein DFH08DRAFT_935985 [Mycena albidolilacea]|uniref:Uncharacterized protein n=1 Tax=Mycena albidolilacea TaxID=1033008 RepID=A0AAD7A4Q3_9AGAR|nr:hypothetical protein DFH08DRAFT_935985 [Mycena albidolilacea]